MLIFSILAAIVLWFIMATVNTNERPRVIYDVPIEVTLPDSALEQGYTQELIKFCRDKLYKADEEIKKMLDNNVSM